LGDNDNKSPDEGIDLLSKLFDEEVPQTPKKESSVGGFGEPTRAEDNSDKTEALHKPALGEAFEVSTAELNRKKSELDSSSTQGFDLPSTAADFTEMQDQPLFDQDPLPDERISFFNVPAGNENSAPADNPFEGDVRDKTIVLEGEGAVEDPIDAALEDFAEMPPEPVVTDAAQVAKAPTKAKNPEPDVFSEDSQKEEVKAEDFAEVFSHNPIQVSDTTGTRRKVSPPLKKLIAASVALLIFGGGLTWTILQLKSDAGLVGYRVEGLSIEKAYVPPSEELLQAFAGDFKESEQALLKDDPKASEQSYGQMKVLLTKDERNAEALSRLLDHSSHLIAWFGTASEWSARMDEAQQQINQVSEKSQAFIDTLIIERAKARRSLIVGDLVAAEQSMQKALERFNVADDVSLLIMTEIDLELGNKERANSWLSKVSDRNSVRARFLKARIESDLQAFRSLAAEGYLPAKVESLNLEKSASDLEALAAEVKLYPTLALKVTQAQGDAFNELGQREKARELWASVLAQRPQDADLGMKLANSYQSDGLWDQAEAAFQSVERAGGLHLNASLQYGRLLKDRGKYLEALNLIKRSVEKYPKSAALYHLQGQVHWQLYQIDLAREAYVKAKEVEPDYEPAVLGLVDIHQQRKDFEEARKLLSAIKPSSRHYPHALESIGNIELALGNPSKAEDYWKKSLAVNASQMTVYPRLTRLWLAQEREAEVAAVLEKIPADQASSVHASLATASLKQFQRKYSDALDELKPSLARFPHDRELRLLQADLNIDSGNLREASDQLRQMMAEEIREPELQYLRAKLFSRDKDGLIKDVSSAEAAIKILETASKEAADSDKFKLLAARLAIRVQERQTAQEFLQEVLNTNPKSSEAHALQGDLRMDAGQYAKASQSYQTALRLTRFRSDLYVRLAESFKQLNQPQLAIQYYSKVTQERPRDAEAWLELGKLYNQEGKFAGAEQALRRSISLNSQLAEAYYFLGFIQKETGNRNGALRSFERFLALSPTSTESATIRDEVYFLKNGGSPN
jgi:tetratricopeptide (TPR) repeat protein